MLVRYFAGAFGAVIVGQMAAIVVALVFGFSETVRFVDGLLGPDLAAGLVGIVGNVAFAAGFAVALKAALEWARPTTDDDAATIGAAAAGAVGFVFPEVVTGPLLRSLVDAGAAEALIVLQNPVVRFAAVFGLYALVAGTIGLVVSLAWESRIEDRVSARAIQTIKPRQADD